MLVGEKALGTYSSISTGRAQIVPHSLHQADELTLVGGKFGGLGLHGQTEQGDQGLELVAS